MEYHQYFYCPDLTNPVVMLSPEESEHCCRALRHHVGDVVWLTDGKGTVARASIMVDNSKACMMEIQETMAPVKPFKHALHLVIAPTKNMDRIEWLVEKCVEIGIGAISFIICDNSERPRVNMERLQRIAVSALKQSQTSWLPPMELVSFKEFLEKQADKAADKYIAWCDDENTKQLAHEHFQFDEVILLVGPEGDFSADEVAKAKEMGYVEIKLGNRRLRTETAGLYGCLLMATKEWM